MASVLLEGVWKLYIAKTPWATEDSDNVVGGEKAMTFLSGDGKDPQKNLFRSGYIKSDSGGWKMDNRIPVVPRHDGGLRPDTDYYVTLRGIKTEGNIQPINIMYVGTDDVEHGGEVLITNDELIQAGVAVPMTFGLKSGVFIPD